MRRPGNSRIERLDRSEIERFVERNSIEKIKDVAATSPFYRWYYEKHSVDVSRLKTIADIRAVVPTVSKSDFLEFQSLDPDRPHLPDVRQIHLTSGTSGVGREVHARTQLDLASIGTGGAYEFVWAGLGPGDRVMLTMPYTQTMAGPYFQGACEAAGVVPINAFSASTEDRLDLLYRFGCAGLVATPSYLHRMTLIARERGLRPAGDLPSLTALFLSGEPYGLQWASEVAAFWGATLCEGWGATQTLGVVMATCERGALVRSGSGAAGRGVLHGLDHRCLIEVLDPKSGRPVAPGETGELVITNLRAKGLPCIRFRMGDRVRLLPLGSCGCGRHFTCYEAGTISRLDDMIKVRGMNVWPSAVDEIVFAEPVTDYSGRVFTDQAGREMIELLVEPAHVPPDSAGFRESLASRIRTRIGVSVEVRLIDRNSIGEVQFKSRRWRDERTVLN